MKTTVAADDLFILSCELTSDIQTQTASISSSLQLSYWTNTANEQISISYSKKQIQIQCSDIFSRSFQYSYDKHLLTCYKDVDSPNTVSSFHKVPHSYVGFHFCSIQDCAPYLNHVKDKNIFIALNTIVSLGIISHQKKKLYYQYRQ